MEKACRGIMGGYSVLKEGDSRTPTHVVLTSREYDELQKKVLSLKEELSSEQRGRELDKIEYGRRLRESDQKITDVWGRVFAAEEELARQQELNDNLLRISKERANAKRGLQPKREHNGYRYAGKIMQVKILESRSRNAKYVYAWSVVLETPYDCEIPLYEIEEKIEADLTRVGGILFMLGVSYFTKGQICGRGAFEENKIWRGPYMMAASKSSEAESSNILFDLKYQANPMSGLWEVQLMTTEEIPVVPELSGPRQKGGGKAKIVIPDLDDVDPDYY